MSSKRIYRIDGEKLLDIRNKIFSELDGMVENIRFDVMRAKEEIDRLFNMLIDLSELEKMEKTGEEPPYPMITEKQKNFLKDLYKKLGRKPPKDMDRWSRATASVVIDDLLKQVREVSKSD